MYESTALYWSLKQKPAGLVNFHKLPFLTSYSILLIYYYLQTAILSSSANRIAIYVVILLK